MDVTMQGSGNVKFYITPRPCVLYIPLFFWGAATQRGSWPPHSRGF